MQVLYQKKKMSESSHIGVGVFKIVLYSWRQSSWQVKTVYKNIIKSKMSDNAKKQSSIHLNQLFCQPKTNNLFIWQKRQKNWPHNTAFKVTSKYLYFKKILTHIFLRLFPKRQTWSKNVLAILEDLLNFWSIKSS